MLQLSAFDHALQLGEAWIAHRARLQSAGGLQVLGCASICRWCTLQTMNWKTLKMQWRLIVDEKTSGVENNALDPNELTFLFSASGSAVSRIANALSWSLQVSCRIPCACSSR